MTWIEADSLVAEILNFEESLNDWEDNFISSLIRIFEDPPCDKLSPRQEEKLLEIYEKVTSL